MSVYRRLHVRRAWFLGASEDILPLHRNLIFPSACASRGESPSVRGRALRCSRPFLPKMIFGFPFPLWLHPLRKESGRPFPPVLGHSPYVRAEDHTGRPPSRVLCPTPSGPLQPDSVILSPIHSVRALPSLSFGASPLEDPLHSPLFFSRTLKIGNVPLGVEPILRAPSPPEFRRSRGSGSFFFPSVFHRLTLEDVARSRPPFRAGLRDMALRSNLSCVPPWRSLEAAGSF